MTTDRTTGPTLEDVAEKVREWFPWEEPAVLLDCAADILALFPDRPTISADIGPVYTRLLADFRLVMAEYQEHRTIDGHIWREHVAPHLAPPEEWT